MMREVIGKVAAITALALVIQATFAGDRSEMRIDRPEPTRVSINRSDGTVRFTTQTSNQIGYHDQLMRPLLPNDGSDWERYVFADGNAPAQSQCFGYFGIVTCWVPVSTRIAAQGNASAAFQTRTGHFACLYARGGAGRDSGPCHDLVAVATARN